MSGLGINEVASAIASAQLAIPSSPTPSTSTMTIKQGHNLDEMRLQTERVGMEHYLAAALSEKKSGKMERYTELIRQLTAVPGTPEAPAPYKLHCWIMLIAQSVSQLNRSCHQLIEAILAMDWTIRGEEFVQSYIAFLGVLVSAHAFYSLPVQKMLVRAMTFRQKFNSLYPDTPSTLTRVHVYTRVHSALKYVLSLTPISCNSLFSVLVSEFPHKSQSIQEHVMYTQNMLRLIAYVPVLQEQILSILVEKMVAIDVEIQTELEELDDENVFEIDMNHREIVPKEQTSVNISDLFDKSITENDVDIVEDDRYEDDDSDSDSDTASNAPQILVSNVREMAEKLDVMMSQVFAHLKTFQTASLTTKDDLIYMLQLLMGIFNTSIITTFKSRHVQFLLFWYAATRPEFADILLGQFSQKAISMDEPVIIRLASSAYSSSFAARANFISPVHVRNIVNLYLGWAHDYIDENEASVVFPTQEKYAVFYAVIQAILYIFCFRWRWLVIDETNELGGFPTSGDAWHVPTHMWASGLTTLQRIIQSRFNPLKICSPNVVRQFARLAHATNFLYVYPILESNRRLFLPPQRYPSFSVSQKNASSFEPTQQDIESFFPFDPIKYLRTSKGYIEPFYQEWDGGIVEEESDDEEDNEDEEEEEMAGVEWSGAVSISPSPRFEALWAGMA